MPSPTKPGSAVDADLQAALEETRAELEAAKSLADDRLEEVQVCRRFSSELLIIWFPTKATWRWQACMSKWQQDREELLHANNRLHEERLELRSILDSERQRLSDVVTSRDLTKPELVRLTSETASLKGKSFSVSL